MDIDPLYYSTVYYRGSTGARIMLKYDKGMGWSWRHPGGQWHGWHSDIEGSGKMAALLHAAHCYGLSGVAMNWEPDPEAKRLFR